MSAARPEILTSVRHADVDMGSPVPCPNDETAFARRDLAPDMGALDRDHARDLADPPTIDLPSAPG